MNAANTSLLGGGGVDGAIHPNISTGVYGYPKDKAANVAIEAVNRFLEQPSSIEEVVFVCFDADNLALYEKRITPGL